MCMELRSGTDWQLILMLSAFGIVIGWLGIVGYTGKIEPILWLLAMIFTTLVIARNSGGTMLVLAVVTDIT